ncbi:MAG: cyclohexanecarboxylate-CoA ligase [bacterium]|nr:cyclohexanecarboxylate-CoA ligase [Deltaproteobacteria bacterium]MCP4904840.1 cyclohexanecarboxylate-CoA ligase [bacterium]
MIDERDLWALIEARANLTPDRTLLIDERSQEIGFAAFRDRAERVAAGLAELGVTSGDRVSWQLPTWIESAVLIGALARLGAVQNPILPIYRERELRHILGEVQPKRLVVPSVWRDFDYAKLARTVVEGSETTVLICDRTLPEGDPAALPRIPSEGRDANAIRWILYTSGTTSSAKGALHSDASIAAGSIGVCESLRIEPEDRWAIPFPVTHISGIGMLMVFLMTGSSGAYVEQVGESTPKLLGSLGCTYAAGGTPLVIRYLEEQRRHPTRPLFPKLKAAMAGAAPKPPQLHGQVRDEMGGLGVVSCYGSTEVPFISVSLSDDDDERLARTEGRANRRAELRIADEEGRPLPSGGIGEIRVRGPQVCRGYLDVSLDRDAFDTDGFFRTGDLGWADAEGYLTITGRLKDVIIRNGENLSAKEIEDVLFDHEGIAEATVIGLADLTRGERCCAVVVPRSGAEIGLEGIAQFCRDAGLASQKIPEQLEFVEALPRNASGKVLKHELQARFETLPRGG